jgi:hypothetical protein
MMTFQMIIPTKHKYNNIDENKIIHIMKKYEHDFIFFKMK